jgi:hypothetical protein
MEPYQPETNLARFKAFWISLGLILLFALLGLFVRRLGAPRDEIDSAAESRRLETLTVVREAQAKAIEAMGLVYEDPQGGHLPKVTIPDALLAKSVSQLRKNTAHKTEQVIPGSKTFTEQQAKQHDPVESFLKN